MIKKLMWYSAIAKSYDELYGEEQKKKAKIILENFKVSSKDFLLDIGCGTGISTKEFNCRKIGLEPEFELLKQADFPVVCGVAEKLPFKNKSFDVVISLTAMHNFKDFNSALQGIERTGKKELVISVLKKSTHKDKIVSSIKKMFNVKKIVDEEKDVILFAKF